MESKAVKKVDWEPVKKDPAKLKLAQCVRKCLEHVPKELRLTVAQTIEVFETYLAWLETQPKQGSPRSDPPIARG